MPNTSVAMAEGDTTPKADPKGKQEVGEQYITLRVGGIGDQWRQYGLLEAPLLLAQKGEDKTQYTPSNYKLILRAMQEQGEKVAMPAKRELDARPLGVMQGEKVAMPAKRELDARPLGVPQADLVAILSREYELYPNEELVKTMDGWTRENGYRRYEDARYSFTSGSGNAVFLTYLPRDETVGSYYIVEGRKDEVKLGFVARNSIDASVGFGLDVFTFRGLCYNGSIVMNELGTRAFNPYAISQNASAKLKHRHTKGLTEVIQNLKANIEQLREVGEQVIAYYRHLATVKVNQLIAEQLANTMLPEKYFEQTGIAFEKEKDKRTGKIISESVVLNATKDMWTVYNDLTASVWHQATTDMRTKWQYFGVLHKALMEAIPPPVRRMT